MSDLDAARRLTPEHAYEYLCRYKDDPASKGWVGALSAAHPSIVSRYAREHPAPGRLIPVVTEELGRKVTRYYGDPRAWRTQFEHPPIPCIITRPG